MKRRAAVAALLVVACGPAATPPLPAPPPVDAKLELTTAERLVAAPGLEWLVVATPRALAGDPSLIPWIASFASEERLNAYAKATGGIDLRRTEGLALAGYRDTRLTVAFVPHDAARAEAAFERRASVVEGRALDARNPQVLRVWGSTSEGREQLLSVGGRAIVLETGRFGPLRASEAFALGRLKRARPALESAPLDDVAKRLGPAPVRIFFPGPFVDEWRKGLGGLMAAATAVGVAVAPESQAAALTLRVRVVVLGAWGSEHRRAAAHLAGELARVVESPIGRLCGADRPVGEPEISSDEDSLRVDSRFDGRLVTQGLRDATTAEIDEIMSGFKR